MVAPDNNNMSGGGSSSSSSTVTSTVTPPLIEFPAQRDEQDDTRVTASPTSVLLSKRQTLSPHHDHRPASPSTPPQLTSEIAPSTQSLETRVADLEEKLATLSKLLAQSRSSFVIGTPPNGSPTQSPAMPLIDPRRLDSEMSPVSATNNSNPPLESPHPLKKQMERSLSQRILSESLSNNITQENPQLAAPLLSEDHVRRKRQESFDGPNNSIVSNPKQKWMDYMNSMQESTPDVDLQMEEFVRIPSQVEQLLSFGFWICVDSFLYTVTMLPLRALWSVMLLGLRLAMLRPAKHANFRFHRRHMYQLIQVSIIYVVYRFILYPISIGKLYHWIRGQAMLKLYVLIAIVEVFDRLMCSLGQDCLDSMYWNTTRRPRSMRMLVSIVVVLCYACVHTAILFVHVATLNVAMNSADHALLTLLISGNFAEIKSTVFKKYNKPNLFKITASDICERFKLALFLTLVLILNMAQGMDGPSKWNYVQMCGIVWCAELLADWIKHSFITKFNFIKSTVYPNFALLLAGDVTGIGHEGVNLDHSHAVVKRIGLAQIPLVCVMLRLLGEASRYLEWDDWRLTTLILVGAWLALLGAKILLGFYLARISWNKLEKAPAVSASGTKLTPTRPNNNDHRKQSPSLTTEKVKLV